MFAVGVVSALVASALFNIGIALQGIEARAAPRSQSLRPSLVGTLLRRPRWFFGLVLGIVGIGPQVLALSTAPFVVVQTVLAAGLLLLLVLGVRVFGESVGLANAFFSSAPIGTLRFSPFGGIFPRNHFA